MKTFKDLTFEPHHIGEGKRAVLQFDNGRGISVVTDSENFFTSEEKPYEVAFLQENGHLGLIYFDKHGVLHLEEGEEDVDVVGYCTAEQITRIMEIIQKRF